MRASSNARQTGPVTRFDETWHRLLLWTQGQTPSERLAALVLDDEGYESIDPAHPLGGRDGGADAVLRRGGDRWVMAVYFPRNQQTFGDVTSKFTSDLAGARKKAADLAGLAFVTNQELRLAERETLRKLAAPTEVDIFHLDRVTTVLDRPRMAGVREQFLGISGGPPAILVGVQVHGVAGTFTDVDAYFDSLVEMEKEDLLERNAELRDRPPPLSAITPVVLRSLGYEPTDEQREPLTDDQIESHISNLRAGLATRQSQCQEYLAAIAWPALHFDIENRAESFLQDVEVILTFRNGRGVKFLGPDKFELERLKDPSWKRPRRQFESVNYLQDFVPAGYPVSWDHNNDGDLEVTINLPQLRPHPPQRLTEDDIVLIAQTATPASLTVSYTVTARGYGTVFDGEPIDIPVRQISMFASLQSALTTASDTADD